MRHSECLLSTYTADILPLFFKKISEIDAGLDVIKGPFDFAAALEMG